MKSKIKNRIALVAALFGVFDVAGCSNDSGSDPTQPSSGYDRVLKVSGRVDLTNAKGAIVKIVVGNTIAVPDNEGRYEISVSKASASGAGRILADSVIDTARIVIGDDTLREIPITTWSAVLPTNYIVQRNVGVEVAAKHAGSKLEAVWWSNDSIANTVVLGQGTSSRKYSGYIYNVYDDAMFGSDAHLYWLFVRITNTSSLGFDSVVAYTNVTDVTAKDGDQVWDSTQFDINTRFKTLGYTLVPDDSSVAVYSKTKTVVMVLDSVVVLDTFALDSSNNYSWRARIDTQNVVQPDSNMVAPFEILGGGQTSMGLYANMYGAKDIAEFGVTSLEGDSVSRSVSISTLLLKFNALEAGTWKPHQIVVGENSLALAWNTSSRISSLFFPVRADHIRVSVVVRSVTHYYRR